MHLLFFLYKTKGLATVIMSNVNNIVKSIGTQLTTVGNAVEALNSKNVINQLSSNTDYWRKNSKIPITSVRRVCVVYTVNIPYYESFKFEFPLIRNMYLIFSS